MVTKKKATIAVKDYVQKLQEKLDIKNINAVPKVDKIIVNF
jgi:ribosomal protein L5